MQKKSLRNRAIALEKMRKVEDAKAITERIVAPGAGCLSRGRRGQVCTLWFMWI